MKYLTIVSAFIIMCLIIAMPYMFSTDIVARQLGGSIIWFVAMLAIEFDFGGK